MTRRMVLLVAILSAGAAIPLQADPIPPPPSPFTSVHVGDVTVLAAVTGSAVQFSFVMTNSTGTPGSPVTTPLSFLNVVLTMSIDFSPVSVVGPFDLASGSTFNGNTPSITFGSGTHIVDASTRFTLSETTFLLANGNSLTLQSPTFFLPVPFMIPPSGGFNTGLFVSGTESSPIPEPASLLLLGTGLVGLGRTWRKRRD